MNMVGNLMVLLELQKHLTNNAAVTPIVASPARSERST